MNKEEFLRDLRSITAFECEHYEDGLFIHGQLTFHSSPKELLERYTSRQLQRGCLLVLKEYMREERKKWYDKWYGRVV